METESGNRFMIVEQAGRDIWRGRHRSLHDAIAGGDAGLGVDKLLLQRAIPHGVKIVMVVVEEQRRIYLTPIEDFFEDGLAKTRANWRGRAHRIVPYGRWHQRYFGPSLQRKRKRATA